MAEAGIKSLLATELPPLLNSMDADIFPSDMVLEIMDTMWYAINLISGCVELPQDYDLEQVLGAYTQQIDEIGAEEEDSAQSALVKALLEQIQLPAVGGITDELMDCIMADQDSSRAPGAPGVGRPETGDPTDEMDNGDKEGSDDDAPARCDLLFEATSSGNYEGVCDLVCSG